jgi:cell division protein FtsW
MARDWLDRPMTSLHLILAVFGLMLGFGLLMVLSSSSAVAFRTSHSAFAVFTNQAAFAALGLVAFFFTMRMPLRLIRSLATTSIIVALVLLVAVLVPGIGRNYNGARSWIGVGDQLQFQPSEVAKLALLLWAAHVLAARRSQLRSLKALLIPLLPVFLLMVGLVMLQPDLGTTVTLSIVFLAVLYSAGAPLWIFAAVAALGALGGVYLATSAQYRAARIFAYLHPATAPSNLTYQLYQGLYGMGSGGIFGVGLGNSKMKWSWLPNADSDFIFAIIGEELGLLGTLTIVALFGLLAYTGMRIARRNVDPFVKIVASAGTIWLVGQAIINIGYVVGLLPVTGIPLPMISSGGTSLVITMIVFGLLANFARREPQAAAALRGIGPRGLAAFLGVGMTPQGSPSRRVTKRRARREAKRAAAAQDRLAELTASSDDYARQGGRADRSDRRPDSRPDQRPEPPRDQRSGGPRDAPRSPAARRPRNSGTPATSGSSRGPGAAGGPKASKPRKYRLRRTFGFPVPGESGQPARPTGAGDADADPARRSPGRTVRP